MQPLNNKPNWTHVKPTETGWYFWRHHAEAAINMVKVQFFANNLPPDASFMIPGCETRRENLNDFSGGEWLGPVTPDTQRTPRDTEIYDLGAAIIKRHNEQTRVYYGDSLTERLEGVLREYEHTAINALSMAKSFRDALLVDFRAVSMVLTMVSNAATHKEKDSRLRGCMELIETVINRLNQEQFDIAVCNRPKFHDPFVSDFPSRKFIERIRQLEDENKALKEAQENQKSTEVPETLRPIEF